MSSLDSILKDFETGALADASPPELHEKMRQLLHERARYLRQYERAVFLINHALRRRAIVVKTDNFNYKVVLA